MNNHIYQPMLFNPDIDIQTKSLTKINKYGTTKVHENMYIYESVSNTSANIINSMYSVLVPSTHTEWIIGYNHTDNKSSFYCIGPVVKKRTYDFGNYEHYLGVCFDDIYSYYAKGVNADTYPSGMTGEIYEYSPLEGSYEYKLIEDFKTSSSFEKHIHMFKAFLENAKQKRNSILFADEELDRLNKEYDGLLNETVSLAEKLSSERKKVASDFEKNVKNELSFLDMPKMQFFVNFDKGNLSSTGFDKIEFMISANPGEPPKSLSKVASGGELSRIMLAIKSIISYNDTIGTLIFDEIDTGVSGRASQKIGLKLKSVSKNTQVICVTHSAQIASNANEHFLIQKKFDDNKTFTSVTPLDFEGRKSELARIMGGLEITDTLLQSAEELLNQNLYGN